VSERPVPGWWCERRADTGASAVASLTRRCARPIEALVWLRIDLRTVLVVLASGHAGRAVRWLNEGQWAALYRLRTGQPVDFPARSRGGIRITWTVRPVRYLPLVCRCAAPGTG
jgi:hypothetical protein